MAAPRTRHGRRTSPAERLVAADRQRFLAAEPLDPRHVRREILASWRRSQELSVAADRIQLEHVADVDDDSRLVRSARPVLDSLRQHLDDQAMSIILTDASGVVLSRASGDAELDRYLDGVQLAPGFRYAESSVGTNGIGTALEVGGPSYVFGHEHFAEGLEVLSCAAAPIRHPLTGRSVGTIDLTCWSRDAGPLLLAMAKATADRIRHAILLDEGARQIALVQEYLRTCRRLPGIVLALADDTVILNDDMRSALDPVDQSALVAHARESLLGTGNRSVHVELPSGISAHLYGTPAADGDPRSVVVHARLGSISRRPKATRRGPGRGMALPGVVGSDPPWVRACRSVESSAESGAWVAVRGEPGTGKFAVLSGARHRHRLQRPLEVLDARGPSPADGWRAAVERTLAGGHHDLVLRHVDEIESVDLAEVTAALYAHRSASRPADARATCWVAVTAGARFDLGAGSALGRLFPTTVDVPPLRLHPADIEPLVHHLLGRLGARGILTCPPSVTAVLARNPWPGNAVEVQEVLREILSHRRAGTLTVDDLPPRVRVHTRRQLTPMEALERDAIVQAILDADGDKAAAAAAVGMSRATIYRKIHHFGIRLSPG
ncbi:MAG: sigma-54-dependent Fis family transcriptional regulator [Phycicoccus sp.]